jgi:uncharacterized RDD family membrane protein YckC
MLGVVAALLAINVMRGNEEEALSFGGRTVSLAPLPRRLIAGLIDISPVAAIALWRLPLTDSFAASDALRSPEFALWMVGAVALYLLHTTVAEVISGRTVGKLACGLRTLSLSDGERPRVSAVLLRNVFRLIDVFPGMPLAILILFSPLRQRLGDVIAGTVVVSEPQAKPAGPEDTAAGG